MPRHENPKDLTLQLPVDHATSTSSHATSRPNSSPIALQGIDLSSIEGSFPLSTLPPLPASPAPHFQQPRTYQDPIKNPLDAALRQNNKSRDRLPLEGRLRPGKEEDDLRPGSSSMSKIYHLRKAPGSTPELSLVGSADSVSKSTLDVSKTQDLNGQRPLLTPQLSEDSASTKRKEKTFRNPLARSKSTRKDSHSSKTKPNGIFEASPRHLQSADGDMQRYRGKERRGKSSERTPRLETNDTLTAPQNNNAMKNALSKAKTGGGNFLKSIGKIGRSGSSHEREAMPTQEEYKLKVINLPLIDQTRITRISKSLDACKDKTEFWMPSLPWRCIDYLNLNCESEGLYRIPGSGPQIKQWQKRFDTELDIDLLDEEELYDPNTISSLLKLWLRELPTDVFPVSTQTALAIELEKDNAEYNKMGQPAPQKLRDALSELPPFNYYLLFAITCHLSLLVSHQEKNRMDLNNLSICIGPCLRIERWLFNYLIGDWRNCWQGCWTEKATLEEEKKMQDPSYHPEIPATTTTTPPTLSAQQQIEDERAVSSGGESMVSAAEHIERPATSSSTRRLASRDNSNTRSSSTNRGLQA